MTFTLSINNGSHYTLSDGSGAVFTLGETVIRNNVLSQVVSQTVNVTGASVIKNNYECGEIIGGHKVVYLKDGQIFKADRTNSECIGTIIGMSNQAGILLDSIEVILQGEITLVGWGLTQNSVYYLSTDGGITSTVPTSGILYKIGVAKDTNTLIVNHNLLINRN